MVFVVDIVLFLVAMAGVVGLGVWAIVTQRAEDGISPLVAHLHPRPHLHSRGSPSRLRRRGPHAPAPARPGRTGDYWRCSPR